MNHCKTCAHWEPCNKGNVGHSQGVGRCNATPMFWDCTEWGEGGDGRVFKAEFANCKAFVQDGSDYSAVLLTLPDFGCVSHSENNKEVDCV